MATRLMIALMDMNATMGGAACHFGGPAGMAELMSAIHGVMFSVLDWKARFNFVNDAGHTENGIYALRANYGFDGMTFEDLKGFRSLHSKLTGHGESHVNPEGVLLSNGPLGSSLPQAPRTRTRPSAAFARWTLIVRDIVFTSSPPDMGQSKAWTKWRWRNQYWYRAPTWLLPLP